MKRVVCITIGHVCDRLPYFGCMRLPVFSGKKVLLVFFFGHTIHPLLAQHVQSTQWDIGLVFFGV